MNHRRSVVWDPFRELDDLSRRMFNMVERFAAQLEPPATRFARPHWVPPVDITEDDEGYLIVVDLPGLRREDVRVTVENRTLVVEGNRKPLGEESRKGLKVHREERAMGHFSRSFVLPEDADEAKVTAEMKEGLLCIRIPKAEAAKPKEIEVREVKEA
ncbi:Hsp20/alpha crystallin family protein [Candidatus Methylacidithermus pantelleriae]|nr:Hsp20/alpha crystallin family protein [Candidatus Methylacidithermus pantelleriae]